MSELFPHGTRVSHPLKKHNRPGVGIGARQKKIDALSKVIGRTPYADDIALPNMVFAKIVRSPHPHARIKHIDKTLGTGVLDVITGADLATKYGVIPWTKDEYPLAFDKARYVGDAVAAVVCASPRAAHEAALALKVEYEILEPVLSVAEAKEKNIVVNEHAKVGNITKAVDLAFGDVDANVAASDFVATHDFYFHNTTHAPIEPHCAIGDFSPEGRLTVYSSTQVPHYLHRTLSEVLNLDAALIRVIQPAVGGAFGGKSECFDLEFVVALAAMRLRRPVKLLYTREEVFLAHRGRHPMNMTMTMGVTRDGRIRAVRNIIDIDGGAYASFGMITAFYAGQLLTGPTNMDSYHFKATRFYTNKPACGPKRGHGSVQPRFAFEVMCDIMAEKCGLDPIAFRKLNAVMPGSKTINGLTINTLALGSVLDTAAERSDWYRRRPCMPKNRGLGIATSMYISGTNYPVYPNDMPQSSVSVRLDRSGAIHIFSGASDIGQGINTLLMQVAIEELGASHQSIRVISGDTDLTPVDLGAYSSRVTLMTGHAALEALRKARGVIAEAVAEHLVHHPHFKPLCSGLRQEELNFHEGRVWWSKNPEISVDLKTAFTIAEGRHGSLVFSGDYRTIARGGDYKGGTIGASPAYSVTAHIADVSVDEQTGFITIHRIYAAHDCGTALNPLLVEGQIEGSTYMGAGEVVLENFVIDSEGQRRGLHMGPSLLDYRLPTTLDTPDIEAMISGSPDQNGPYGAKEAGEGPLHSTIPAVANAIYHAVGIRLLDLPFSPEKVLSALKRKG